LILLIVGATRTRSRAFLTRVIVLFVTCGDVFQIPNLLIFVLFIFKELLGSQISNGITHSQFSNVPKGLIGYLVLGVESLVLLKMLFVVNAHFKLGKVLFLAACELDRCVSQFLNLLTLVKVPIVELVLVVNNEMVGTISKWHDGSVRKTPTETPGHCYRETKFVSFWCELRDVEVFWIERSNLIKSLILCFVFLLILYNLSFQ
jgi:hypothetical protein